ncbi:MAG: M15 family metallopeptidase [Synechococcaceae cyanobacterium]|nr:M15 family metallopeptidase [Synechococcaceae cyanobacterium]
MRPWSSQPIQDNGESLQPLPEALQRLQPHPYQALGAPYGEGGCPFRLRSGVVTRLLRAQDLLRKQQPEARLAIFDGWRPVAVQRFMVQHSLAEECRRRGLDPAHEGTALQEVRDLVARFWADPSEDPGTPPPHSTGAAVDLTLADALGQPLAMGGEIDALGPVSEPDHHARAAAEDPAGDAALWHQRRQLLAAVMVEAGFIRHPHEWWHFSHGDQLWAWASGAPLAVYGRTDG